jgi:hypothetical protein
MDSTTTCGKKRIIITTIITIITVIVVIIVIVTFVVVFIICNSHNVVAAIIAPTVERCCTLFVLVPLLSPKKARRICDTIEVVQLINKQINNRTTVCFLPVTVLRQ